MPVGSDGVEDDESILDEERLVRRLHPTHVIYDHNRQRWRATSAAFRPDPDGVSVVLSSVLVSMSLTEKACVDGYDGHSAVVLEAGAVRSMQPPLRVARDPDPPDLEPHVTSPAHGLLKGIPSGKPGKRVSKQLAEDVATEFVEDCAPLGPAEEIAQWAAQWGLSPEGLRGITLKITEAVDFMTVVADLDPDLRVKIEGAAAEDLMARMLRFGRPEG